VVQRPKTAVFEGSCALALDSKKEEAIPRILDKKAYEEDSGTFVWGSIDMDLRICPIFTSSNDPGDISASCSLAA
jgi:hypothetical protein